MRIGCIGLGRMGEPIAKNIIAEGHEVRIYDTNAAAGRGLIRNGAFRCDSPAELSDQCTVVILSLPGPREVNDVVLGPAGVIRNAQAGAVIVDTSTIGPEHSRNIFHSCEGAQISYLDAPVSGGVEAAIAGTLTTMVGGSRAALERARPVLECFSEQIFYLGSAGAGSTMKLIIQAIFLSQTAAFLEAISIGQRSGLGLQTMLEIIAASSAHHPTIGKRYGKIIAQDWIPRFEIEAAVKDLSLVQGVCNKLDYEAPIVRAVVAAYARADEAGLGEKDLIALLALP